MSSLVERLRVRSDRRPIYNLDESDDDADVVPGKPGTTQENFEKIDRSDAVSLFFYLIFCLLTYILLFYSYNRYIHIYITFIRININELFIFYL